MSDSSKKWQYGRDILNGTETIINGRIQESEVIQPDGVNTRLCELRRKLEFEREIKACDYSLESIEI